jgi:hypothetical protein
MNNRTHLSEFTIVTTFSESGWNKYGYKFAETMDMWLPKNLTVLLYYEGDKPAGEFSDRMQFISFNEQCGERQNQFEVMAAPHERAAVASITKEAEFKFQASRFAHKYHVCEHAINSIFTKYLVWIDADVIALKNVPSEFFNSLVSVGSYWSRISRGQEYPECGFMVWNREHEVHEHYWGIMKSMYNEGYLFKLREWHDSYVWWEAEKLVTENTNNDIMFDLGDGQPGHGFVRGVLGEYFDHLKGPRKIFGFSPERKSCVHKIFYSLFFNVVRLVKKIK